MFWRIGFSTTSSLDTLLEKANVTVEEVLDDADLLQECKSQNSKLVEYLQQPRIVQRLLEHVVGMAEVEGDGGSEWEEKVRFKYPYMASEVLASDIWAILDIILAHQDDLLKPFWNSVLSANPAHAEPPLTHFTHPLLNGETQKAEEGGGSASASASKKTINAQENGPGRSVLAGYWAKVNGVFLEKKPLEMLAFIRSLPRSVERFVAHLETPAVVDLLYRMIQLEEATPEAGTIEWLADNGLVEKLVDLLSPRHSPDLHNTVSELFKAVIAFSAPSATNLPQGQGADAFGSSAFGGADSFASARAGGTNNRLVRQLASEEQIRKMVHFMLDFGKDGTERGTREAALEGPSPSTSSSATTEQATEAAAEKDGNPSAVSDETTPPSQEQPGSAPALSSTEPQQKEAKNDDFPPVRAPEVDISTETMTSSLVTCIGVLIELIRKNNSDYFEQHLFHTLRQYLIQRQQDFTSERRGTAFSAADTSMSQDGGSDDFHRRMSNVSFQEPTEDEQLEAMEQAMEDYPSKLGIVHLGPMLTVLCERLPEFQHLLMNPRTSSAPRKTTLGELTPLTFERYRITELYAELLHCSNMALLNRNRGDGPQYSEQGTLQGGVDGFQMLARTMGVPDDTEAPDDSAQEAQEPTSTTGDLSMSIDTDGTAGDENVPPASAGTGAETLGNRPSVHARGRTQHVRDESAPESATSSNDTDDEAILREVSTSEPSAGNTPTLDVSPALSQGESESGKGTETPTAPSTSETDTVTTLTSTSTEPESESTHAPSTSEPATGTAAPSKPTTVGDLLKQKFIDCNIVPSLLTLFFEFPWNNFLHNVVYDILQQFFNGRMDIGLNRQLTIDVFSNGKLTDKIVDGHKRNEESSRGPRRIRLGYMGHMNLIAEETVKLLDRYPTEIAEPTRDSVKQPEWADFVNQSLRENREREAAPLAGGPPVAGRNLSFGASSADDDDDGPHIMSDNHTFASYIGAGSSDDDDSDEEGNWLAAGVGPSGHRGASFDDAFGGPSAGGMGSISDSQDDDWGPFADSNDASGSFSTAFGQEANLTPADWSRDFRRAFDDEDGDIETSAFGNDDESSTPTASSPQTNVPFVDLFDPAAVRRTTEAHSARLSGLGGGSGGDAGEERHSALETVTVPAPSLGGGATASSLGPIRPRSRTSSLNSNSSSGSGSSSAAHSASSASAAAAAASAVDPVSSRLGPGVAPDTEVTSEGKLKRVIDGREVAVPLDDVAVAAVTTASSSAGAGGDASEKDDDGNATTTADAAEGAQLQAAGDSSSMASGDTASGS
ncbi:hypothetical protein V8E36_004270 [Tilletia maclaganii]